MNPAPAERGGLGKPALWLLSGATAWALSWAGAAPYFGRGPLRPGLSLAATGVFAAHWVLFLLRFRARRGPLALAAAYWALLSVALLVLLAASGSPLAWSCALLTAPLAGLLFCTAAGPACALALSPALLLAAAALRRGAGRRGGT